MLFIVKPIAFLSHAEARRTQRPCDDASHPLSPMRHVGLEASAWDAGRRFPSRTSRLVANCPLYGDPLPSPSATFTTLNTCHRSAPRVISTPVAHATLPHSTLLAQLHQRGAGVQPVAENAHAEVRERRVSVTAT